MAKVRRQSIFVSAQVIHVQSMALIKLVDEFIFCMC